MLKYTHFAKYLVAVGFGMALGWWASLVNRDTPATAESEPTPLRQSATKSANSSTLQRSPTNPLTQKLSELENIRNLAEPGKPNSALINHLRKVLSTSWEGDRERDWGLFMAAMRPEDAEGVRLLFREADSEGRWYDTEFRQFWTMWGELDGQRAIEYALQNEENPNPVVIRSLKGWASKDSAAALAWAEANGGTNEKTTALDGMGDSNVDNLLAYLDAHPQDPNHDSALANIPHKLTYQRGIAATIEWSNQLCARTDLAPEVKQRTLETVLELSGRGGPAGLIKYIETSTEKPDTPRAGQIIANWMGDFPERGIALLDEFPEESPARFAGSKQLLEGWINKDVASSSIWLKAHPDHPGFIFGAKQLARQLEQSDPAAAAAWKQAGEQSQYRRQGTGGDAKTIPKR